MFAVFRNELVSQELQYTVSWNAIIYTILWSTSEITPAYQLSTTNILLSRDKAPVPRSPIIFLIPSMKWGILLKKGVNIQNFQFFCGRVSWIVELSAVWTSTKIWWSSLSTVSGKRFSEFLGSRTTRSAQKKVVTARWFTRLFFTSSQLFEWVLPKLLDGRAANNCVDYFLKIILKKHSIRRPIKVGGSTK